MQSNISKEIKNTELFMLVQFIDVLNVMEKYKNIEDLQLDIKNRKKLYLGTIEKMSTNKDFMSLNLYNETIDSKIENCREIYTESLEYKNVLKNLSTKYKKLNKKLDNCDKEQLEEVKNLIYEVCDFDVHLAYKIGLIEGMKLKNKGT